MTGGTFGIGIGIGIIGCGEISVARNTAFRGLADSCRVATVTRNEQGITPASTDPARRVGGATG